MRAMFPQLKSYPAGMIFIPRARLIFFQAKKIAAPLLRNTSRQNIPTQRLPVIFSAPALLWKHGTEPLYSSCSLTGIQTTIGRKGNT